MLRRPAQLLDVIKPAVKTRAVPKSVDPDFVVNIEGAGDFIAPSVR